MYLIYNLSGHAFYRRNPVQLHSNLNDFVPYGDICTLQDCSNLLILEINKHKVILYQK